jgi:ribosomal protein S18 acetylase RimI-like enzyme
MTWTLNGGERVTLRRATMVDRAGMRAFVASLSRESRYFRYLTGGRVADETIDAMMSSGQALVVTAEVDGQERIVANGHCVADPDRVGDFAVAVADAWQGKGIGRRLIRRLVESARRSGLRVLRGDVLSENRRMLALLRDAGFSTRRNPEDSLLHEASIALDVRQSRELPADWFSAR